VGPEPVGYVMQTNNSTSTDFGNTCNQWRMRPSPPLRDPIAVGHSIIISEAAPIPHKDIEYCLLSEGRIPAQKNPQQISVFSKCAPPPPGGGFFYPPAPTPHFKPKPLFRTQKKNTPKNFIFSKKSPPPPSGELYLRYGMQPSFST